MPHPDDRGVRLRTVASDGYGIVTELLQNYFNAPEPFPEGLQSVLTRVLSGRPRSPEGAAPLGDRARLPARCHVPALPSGRHIVWV